MKPLGRRLKPHLLVFGIVLGMTPYPAPAQNTSPRAPKTTDRIDLRRLPKIAEVDPRFQSFNVEMVEVTGGRFWAPYGGPAGEVYRQRPPIDLSNVKLRNLTRALAPAYMRVSGTWANTTYIQKLGETVPASPPPGFSQILTRDQWRGVIGFAEDLNLAIITSFSVSPGARGTDGIWETDQAERLFTLTAEFGGRIAAAELVNEPSLAILGGLPKGYGAADYVKDFAVFRSFARNVAPGMLILGPGSVGEAGGFPPIPFVPSAEMMKGTAGDVDAVSYHFYGATSQRCAAVGGPQTSAEPALDETWLSLTERDHNFYAGLRDKYEPGKPMWLTETGQAACGGSPWAARFRDTFRYVDQLGRLARRGVRVVAHNTLAASDYALIDGDSLEPRPSYWAAVLWRRLMGTTVLEVPNSSWPGVKLYAQCLRGDSTGVAMAAINLDDTPHTIDTGYRTTRYVLTANGLDAAVVAINGVEAKVSRAGRLPNLTSQYRGSRIVLPAYSISFLAINGVSNPACQGS